MENEIQIDPERQDNAKQYARINRIIFFIELLSGLVYIIIWLVLGLSDRLYTFIQNLNGNDWWLVISFAVVFGAVYYLLTLPMTFFDSYHLPHYFDQSNISLKDWIVDQLKNLVITFLLGGLIIELVYWVLRISPDFWWFWMALIMVIINVIMVAVAPLILFSIFYRFTPLSDENQELIDRLTVLGQRAKSEIQGIFTYDMSRRTKAANAALIGSGRTRRIILGDTLISEFSDDEIETIVAHELGHQVNKDMATGIIIQGLLTIIGLFLTSILLRLVIGIFSFSGSADIRTLPLFILAMSLFGFITMPLSNAYSRYREYRADRFAVEITQNSRAFISAMTRLANQNLADIEPEPWVEFFLYSHPSISKRIQMAEKYSKSGNENRCL